MQDKIIRKLFLGFIQVHILHHASKAPIYGAWLINELSRKGYVLSPGTLYPMLHQLEALGLLEHYEETINGKRRKNYILTSEGAEALVEARVRVENMYLEIREDEEPS